MGHDADGGFQVNRNLRALWRFSWLLLIAVGVAILVPMSMLYKVKWPPTPRARPAYVAKTQILVNSTTGPFLRTQPKIVGTQGQKAKTGQAAPTQTQPVVPSVSDTKSLVDA